MVKNIIFLFFIVQSLMSSVFCSANFEKIIWLYWADNFQASPLLVQLCVKKFQLTALKSNWTLNLVTDDNLHQHIKNMDNYRFVLKNSQRNSTSEAKSDLIRLFLLTEHGGVWFDISTLLLNEFQLDWLQNLNDYSEYIINKFTQKPKVLLFTWANYQSTQISFDQLEGKATNQHPGFQMWFIASTKNSSLIKEWKQTYVQFTYKGYEHYHSLMSKQDVFLRNLDCSESYWSGNMALVYLLHKRQKQLDQNFSTLLTRKNVFQHYGLWHINSEVGPMFSSASFFQRNTKLLVRTKQQLETQFQTKILLFLKINGPSRRYLHQITNQLVQFNQKKLDIQHFIQSKPTQNDCRSLKFIVKGSLIQQQLLSLSQELKSQLKNAILSVQQRQKWQKYCIGLIFPEKYKDYQNLVLSESTKYRQISFQDLLLAQNLTIFDRITRKNVIQTGQIARVDLLKLNTNTKIQTYAFFQKYVGIHHFILSQWVFCIVLILIFAVTLFSANNFLQKLLKSMKNNNFKISNAQNSQQDIEHEVFVNLKIESQQMDANRIAINTTGCYRIQKAGLFLLNIVLLSFGLLLFKCINVYGMHPALYTASIFYIILQAQSYFFSDAYESNFWFQTFVCNNLQILLDFFCYYGVISLLFNRQQWIIQYTISIGFILPVLFEIGNHLLSRSESSPLLKFILDGEKYSQAWVLLFIFTQVFFPNLRHMLFFEDYYGHFIARLLHFILLIMFICIGYYLFKNLNHEQNSLSDKRYCSKLSRAYLLVLLFYLLVRWMCSFHTKLICNDYPVIIIVLTFTVLNVVWVIFKSLTCDIKLQAKTSNQNLIFYILSIIVTPKLLDSKIKLQREMQKRQNPYDQIVNFEQ